MHWILQNNMYSEAGYEKLVEALRRNNSSYSEHKVIPFSHELEPEYEPQAIVGKVVVMGSYTLAKIAEKRGWTPGAWMLPEFTIQQGNWSNALLNRRSRTFFLRDVPTQREPFFIRPIEDSKVFTGQVMDWPEFSKWLERVLALRPEDAPTVTGETVVIVAPLRPISREWRTWIVNERVVTASQYKLGNRKVESDQVDERVITFAQTCARVWSPAQAYCLDVFESEGELYIGEVNCLNAAGFYAGDMGKLVHAIEEMVG